MVRKRAHAEKALSPPKEMPNRKGSRSRSISDTNDSPSKRAKKSKKDIQEEKQETNVQESDSVIENNVTEEDETAQSENEVEEQGEIEESKDCALINISNCFDELPDFNDFSQELSDKAKSYWDAVKQDYHDFSNWTCLLQSVTEVEENIEAARGVYNCFLRYYPYCYGYWKKFADIERKSGNIEEAKKVFERGVAAIPISIDLWVHYLNFSKQQNTEKGKQQETRDLFNRAIDAAGMEFKSNKLWDSYIEWEKSTGKLKNVTEIYDRLIATPTQQYIKSWQKFKAHLEKHSPIEIIPTKEYGKLVKEIDSLPPGLSVDEDSNEGENCQSQNEDSDSKLEAFDDGTMRETFQKMRSKVLKKRQSLFLTTANEIEKRLKYEDAIKRPYFHVKPLEKSQVKNWKDYLDYEIHEGNHKRIVFLFERCIVVCAFYEALWEKFLNYIEMKDADYARTVFSRACNIHITNKYKIHLRWAVFEERQNKYEKAASILRNVDIKFPGMTMITQKRVGVARRMNRLDEAVAIYQEAIHNAEMIEDKVFYNIKLAHVLTKFCNEKNRGREVLWSALQLGKKRKRLYLQLVELELHYGAIEWEFVNRLFDSALTDMSVDADFRECLAQRKVECYIEYGDDVDQIEAVERMYRKPQDVKETTIERPSKDPTHRRESTEKTKRSADVSLVPDHNAHVQQQWHPPPPDGANYYGWYGNFSNYNQRQ